MVSLFWQRYRASFILLGLGVVFILPYCIARFLYLHPTWLDLSHTTQKGRLITPPKPLRALSFHDRAGTVVPWSTFKGKWVLLYFSPGVCLDACQKNLHYMHQVQIALGKNRHQIQRVFVRPAPVKPTTTPPVPPSEKKAYQTVPEQEIQWQDMYPQLIVLHTDMDALKQFLLGLPGEKTAFERGYLYLIDPMGRMMMGYDSDADPMGEFKDLKHLISIASMHHYEK